ncbi:hypothetical protein ABMA28_015746 [Loxostege sticticalis]|uniref:TIL domain-containing protein n=1 Tax=Loxostege sticticalis TaxID=481309 RepID=A0ABD0TAW2_LOXSC
MDVNAKRDTSMTKIEKSVFFPRNAVSFFQTIMKVYSPTYYKFTDGLTIAAPTCKANEVYSDCVNGGCDARNCSQLGKPVPCVKIRPEACVKGCVCGDGYLRADNGTCIPVKECRK